jgi:hypothetical protein
MSQPALEALKAAMRAGKWPTGLQVEAALREAGCGKEEARHEADIYERHAYPEEVSARGETRELIAALRSFRIEA